MEHITAAQGLVTHTLIVLLAQVDEEWSIGDYVLRGSEIAVIEARHTIFLSPGVLSAGLAGEDMGDTWEVTENEHEPDQ